MLICIAQTRPIKGDVSANSSKHLELIDHALRNKAQLIVFPELSLTGYEPELADSLAMTLDDSRLDVFEQCSNDRNIALAIGIPLRHPNGVSISLAVFQPYQPRQVYSKNYLHEDELPFFVPGPSDVNFNWSTPKIALAICYELTVSQHSHDAFEQGAEMYIASSVKSVNGIAQALSRLSDIARQYSMITMLSNCIGVTGGYDCPGGSCAFDAHGRLIAQLDKEHEGILVIDSDTLEFSKLQITSNITA